MSVADVIDTDYSNPSDAASAIDLLINPLGMGDCTPGPALPESMGIEVGCGD